MYLFHAASDYASVGSFGEMVNLLLLVVEEYINMNIYKVLI